MSTETKVSPVDEMADKAGSCLIRCLYFYGQVDAKDDFAKKMATEAGAIFSGSGEFHMMRELEFIIVGVDKARDLADLLDNMGYEIAYIRNAHSGSFIKRR